MRVLMSESVRTFILAQPMDRIGLFEGAVSSACDETETRL